MHRDRDRLEAVFDIGLGKAGVDEYRGFDPGVPVRLFETRLVDGAKIELVDVDRRIGDVAPAADEPGAVPLAVAVAVAGVGIETGPCP
jgi:hypothetical protein